METTRKLKSAAKRAAGKTKEEVKDAGKKTKDKIKSRYEDYKSQRARKKRIKQEAKEKAEEDMIRKKERERVKKKYSGSSIGRKIKGFADKVKVLAEDTGGAFGDGGMSDKLALGSGKTSDDFFGSSKQKDYFGTSGGSDMLDLDNQKSFFDKGKKDIEWL